MEKNIEIIYENEDILIVNKPAGVAVHPALNNESNDKNRDFFVTDWLSQNYPEVKKVGDEPNLRPGIVHRLDKETSGIMLIAKNQKAFEYFKRQFKEKNIKKTYLALVYGKLIGKGIIDKPIGIKSGSIKRSVNSKDMKMIKDAITEYKVLRIFKKGEYTLLEVSPHTGRTHQIRVHLASIGHPIVGDKLYGRKKDTLSIKRHFLHAYSLEFNNLDGTKMKIEAELPYELQEILESLDLKEEEGFNEIEYD